MTCPNCQQPAATIKTVLRRGKLVTGCAMCLDNIVRHNELSAKHRRNYQSREYRKDIIQPFEPEYVKARGIDAAREAGWSDDAIRKFG